MLSPLRLMLGVVLLGFAQLVWAAELQVTVLEKGTGDPVSDATVVLSGSGEYATTDERGRVSFEDAGLPQAIKILGVGYETFKGEVSVAESVFYLYPITVESDGLTVIEERIPDKVSKVTLARDELRKAPGSQGDPLKVVQSLPGVVARGAQMYVRGSGSGGNGIWVNRQPLSYLYHWGDVFGGVSTINPALVKDFNAFLGGFPVEYGDRLGGYLDVQLRPPQSDRVHQNYRIAVNEASMLVEGPVTKNDSFYVAGRSSYLNVLLTPDRINKVIGANEGDSAPSIVTVPQYYDAQALWRHELNRGAIDMQYFGAGDELAIVLNNTANTDPELMGQLSAKTNYQTAGVTWRQQWHTHWDSVAAMSINNHREEQTIGLDATGQPYFIRGDYLTFRAQPELHWRRGEGEVYAFGGEATYGRYPVDLNISREPTDSDPDFNLTTADKYQVKTTIRAGAYAPYIKQRKQWSERWVSALGLRYAGIRGSNGIEMKGLSPRAAVEYQATPKTRLHASWGRYLQMPAESHLLKGFGNPRLDFTEAEHRIVGIGYQFNPLWHVLVEAYHKPMKYLSVPVVGRAPPDNYANIGSGEAYGVDILIKREYSSGKMGWLSYSWGRSKRRDDNSSYNFSGDQPHTLTMVWSQPLPGSWRRWSVGIKFQARSGQPYTPVAGREQWCYGVTPTPCAVPETDPSVFWRPVYADVNSGRLPTYYMLHLRIDRPIRFNTWNMNVYVDMQNVTGAENVIGYDYGDSYENWQNPKKATMLPFVIPFFGIEASF